ncbi:MAG: Transcription-repair-coupling factor [Chlamydiae bacterium]|nr:Transcription-repair-coupling factor [Chlamydiota bacterium]
MIKEFSKLSTFTSFKEKLDSAESIALSSQWQASKSLLLAVASHATKRQIVVISSIGHEAIYSTDLANFEGLEVLDLPSWESLPSENIEPSPDIVGERAAVLNALLKQGGSTIIVTNLQSALVPIVLKKQFEEARLNLKVGDEIEFRSLIEKLAALGYQRTTLVNDKGEFAVRGGIIDVFPSSEMQPFRIEFFGDEIESMRAFDPVHQVSTSETNSLDIFATKELELLKSSDEQSSIFSYLSDDAIIFVDNPLQLKQKYQELSHAFDLENDYLFRWENLIEQIEPFQKVVFEGELNKSPFNDLVKLDVPILPFDEIFPAKTKIVHKEEQTYLVRLPQLGFKEYHFHYLCQGESEEKMLKEQMIATYDKLPENVSFGKGNWSSSWVFPKEKVAYVSSAEVTQRYVIKRKKQRTAYHSAPIEFMALEQGNYVVHMQHGIGRYLGCERRKNHLGMEVDYLYLEYADKAKLFVPLDQSHLVSKYIGAKHESPKLHQIGGKIWLKTKVQTERAIVDYASELLKMHAQRALKDGVVYPKDSEEFISFEKEFPYTETEDQLQAIEAIKEDFNSGKPVDRLICGDVGYGKTEVAMRAAFKAVVDGGFQVVVLVPTTILAMQHFDSFCQRMGNFPVNIGVLSRFVHRKKQKEYLEGLENGKVDIVIGTHRVISKDVKFKNLGLVIIDEEQRFGVKAKEHLRSLKMGANCLTLSATPIPRTLYMSLVGARDISLINSPPQDRLPIKSQIIEEDPDTLKKAILREISRDGQVYIVHNRVASIYRYAEKIQKLVPEARILIGHGQMPADELDQVFHGFKNHEADILIATTIIESGVDIPNANTIIVDKADVYGLSDLYQLRGRVGRWNRKAYAYFVIQKNKMVLEIAQKRLSALLESSGYGGGMKIAMRDLEIRGAGEILGTSQSGHVSAIGFHLYCKLLKRTILSMQGQAPKTITETKIEFPVDCRIPDEYVPDLPLRMELYQRMGDAFTMESLKTIYTEMIDRFGRAPDSVLWLYHMQRLKVFTGSRKYTEIIYKKNFIIAKQRVKGEIKERPIPYVMPKEPHLFEEELISVLKD